MSLLGVLFKSILILAFLLLIGELACDNYSAYLTAKQTLPEDLTKDANQTDTVKGLIWEPVAVSKKSLETAYGKAVRLEWEKFGVFAWLSKQGLTYLLYAVGVAVLSVMYYRHRLASAVKRQGDSFTHSAGYGKETTKQMNKLYNDERFREWRRNKLEQGEQEE